jgi:hypothetical protein
MSNIAAQPSNAPQSIDSTIKEGRMSLARKIYRDQGLATTPTMLRQDFDNWIIDNGMATDPGTSDTKSLARKGFIQERTQARMKLNNGAKLLPEGESFAITINPKKRDEYTIETWGDSAIAFSNRIGNDIEHYTQSKSKKISAMSRLVKGKDIDGQDTGDLILMLAQLDGYGILLHKKILAEVNKYNKAIAMVEATAKPLLDAPE